MKIERIKNALEKNGKGKSKARPCPFPHPPTPTPVSFWTCIRLLWWTTLECKMVLSFTERDKTKSGKSSVWSMRECWLSRLWSLKWSLDSHHYGQPPMGPAWSSVSCVGLTWCRKVLPHWLWEAAAQRVTCRLYPRSGWRPLALTEVSTQVRCSQEPISSTQISQALHGSSGGFLVVNLRCERKWR